MKLQRIKNITLIVLVILITGGSIWLPGYLMKKNNNEMLSDIKEVPAEYYSGPSEAIIKNASKQLTYEQCLQLILGSWESTTSETSEEFCNINEFGIKTILTTRVEDLYAKHIYPVTLSSGIDKWYSWSATPYRAIDTTFKTYAAIYWDIRFFKYDGSEKHRFIVSESGDILYAEGRFDDRAVLGNFTPKTSNSSYLFYYYGEYLNTIRSTDNLRIINHNSETTSYRTSTATDAEKEKLDTAAASSFIDDFQAFSPDNVFSISQATGNAKPMDFYASYQKTDHSYKILLLPKD